MMRKATDKSTQGNAASFMFPQVELAAFNGNVFSAYLQASQALLESAAALNQEMVRFANERLQSDAQALRDLQKCTSWEDAVTVQSDYARLAGDAYSAEMPKLTEHAARTCTAALAPLFESAKTLPEAVTLPEAAKKS